MCQHSHYSSPRRRREREKGSEKILQEIIAENFLNTGKEIIKPSPGSTESTRKEKPKEEHTKTQSNQIEKNQRQR